MCFSFSIIGTLLIWAIAIGAAFAILNLVVPFVLAKTGAAGGAVSEVVGLAVAIIKIVIWAAVCIFIVIIAFDIISCLFSMGGGLPRLHG